MLLGALTGCGTENASVERAARPHEPIEDNYGAGGYRDIQFLDDVDSNASLEEDLTDLAFIDLSGKPVSLKDYRGRNLVLVITRGSARYICIYCSTLTSRMVAQYEEFKSRNAEILIVFPLRAKGEEVLAEDFLKFVRDKLEPDRTSIPFPVVLDMELHVVDKLGLRQNLARPATYILDAEGQLRFAYVGASQADRPSIKALLEQLDALKRERKAEAPSAGVEPSAESSRESAPQGTT
jgi:peroxiredoxin